MTIQLEQSTTTLDALDALRWRAVQARDVRFDGTFVYAVRSTGIYCRPTCPSRRPRPDRVAFFSAPDDAEAHGFRACMRCKPRGDHRGDPQTAWVLAACQQLEGRHESLPQEGFPSLAELSASVGATPAQLTQAFRKLLGLTPWQYADALQADRLKASLRSGPSVTAAVYEAGYSSPSRVYERSNKLLGMTPHAYRNGGKGMTITYAVVPCTVGQMMVAVTEKGVCAVHLGDDPATLEAELETQFPEATTSRDDGGLQQLASQVALLVDGPANVEAIPLDIQASAFRRRVWEALQAIPYGETRTYGEIARSIGAPGAARAVGTACASNPVAVVVPCHRAVPATGGTGAYRWGKERKAALLAHEKKQR